MKSSPIDIDREDLLDRFCRYCRIDTQADENAAQYPSSKGQLELGQLLVRELQEFGLTEVQQNRFGIVTATIPESKGNLGSADPKSGSSREIPVIALLAHLDTSPETSGKDVHPQIHRSYGGQPIVLPGNPDKILDPQFYPELLSCINKTVITTDGTTLLGADNKAGVAVIMQFTRTILAHPEIAHGPIRICFTCDEEIGHGVDHVDIPALGAVAAYTLDGAGAGEIEAETFSADKASITIRGVDIHPSVAKDKMVNAIRLCGYFLSKLPQNELSPETTSGRAGFIHPYTIEGGVAEVKMQFLLRDFATQKLRDQETLLRNISAELMAEYPKASIQIQITEQYRNMAEKMNQEPRAVRYAADALRKLGLNPIIGSVRGGTDGSQLTAKGLPTPNLSTGEHNPHSPLEWTCLEEMECAVQGLIALAQRWAEPD